MSFNYYDQKGTAKYNDFRRGSIRANTSFIRSKLSFGENVALALNRHYGGTSTFNDAAGEDGILGKDILMQPVVPVYDIAGNFAGGRGVPGVNEGNPLKNAWQEKNNITKENQVFGNAFASYSITPAISLRTNLGFDLRQNSFSGFTDITPEDNEANLTNGISEWDYQQQGWVWSNTASLVKAFARHSFDLLLGQEASGSNNRFVQGSMNNLINTTVDSRYLQDALGDPSTKNVFSNGGKNALLSLFGKIGYNFADKYVASFTLRRDGSSNLAPGHRWGTFPAFGLGWHVTNERQTMARLRTDGVTLEDDVNSRPVSLTVDQINVAAKNLSNLPRTNLTANVSLRWNTNGTIRTELTASTEPASVDAHLVLDRVELRPLDPYLEPYLSLFIIDSKVGLDGRVRLRREAGQLPVVTFTGAYWLDDFATVDGVMGEDLIKWRTLRLDGIDASLNPPTVTVAKVELDDLVAHLTIETNRSINLLTALRPQNTNHPAASEAAAQKAESPPAQSATAGLTGIKEVMSRTNGLALTDLAKVSIASVVIGGTSLYGGVGGAVGSIFGALVPYILSSKFATGPEVAAIGSATIFGMFIGTAGQGQLSDRFGRRFIYQFNLLLFGVFTILGAFAPSVTLLIICRFIAGLGLGAEHVGERENIAGGARDVAAVHERDGSVLEPLVDWRRSGGGDGERSCSGGVIRPAQWLGRDQWRIDHRQGGGTTQILTRRVVDPDRVTRRVEL